MSAPLPLRFLTSSPAWSAMPASDAEIAFAGRSNVGKSSLLNALAHRKGLANVSGTPGRTRLLNVYGVGDTTRTVVDLPGYGYAKLAKSERARLASAVRGYLLNREPLEMLLLLVDGEVGPTQLDLDVLDDLREHRVPHTIVATKQDKVKPSQRERRRRDLAARCALDPDDVVWVSANTGAGIERLRGLARLWLALG